MRLQHRVLAVFWFPFAFRLHLLACAVSQTLGFFNRLFSSAVCSVGETCVDEAYSSLAGAPWFAPPHRSRNQGSQLAGTNTSAHHYRGVPTENTVAKLHCRGANIAQIVNWEPPWPIVIRGVQMIGSTPT